MFYVGGYDPKTPRAFFERLDKEGRRYAACWNVDVTRGPIDHLDGVARSTVRASGRSADGAWEVETDVHFFSLEPVVQRDFADPLHRRVGRYLMTFADYVATGTMFAFFRTNWRFALYFLYPFVALLAFALIALAPLFVALALGIEGSTLLAALLFGSLAAILLVVLLRTLGRRWFVPHLMDLWSFSRAWVHGRRPDAERLFARYGRVMAGAAEAKATEAGGYDEIVMIGHSTGGALILEIAHAALEADPDFPARAPRTVLLTVGSTALKIGLHPEAERFRERVQRLHDAGLDWVEYQSLVDIINFEGTDPVAEMKLDRTRDTFGLAQRVRIRNMLERATYRRIRRNPFRVHYQFVFANTLRYHYDFHSICFGPLALLERARDAKAVVPHLAP